MEINAFAKIASQAPVPNKLNHNSDAVAKVCSNATVLEGSTSGSLKSEDANNSSDTPFCNDNDYDYEVGEGDDVSDYDYEEDYTYYDDEDDDYRKMQVQFDNLDLHPGVEASVSWLNNLSPNMETLSSTSRSILNDLVGQAPETGSMATYEAAKAKQVTATSSSTVLSSAGKKLVETENEVLRKFKVFNRFDTVSDFSDHHFTGKGFSRGWQPTPLPELVTIIAET